MYGYKRRKNYSEGYVRGTGTTSVTVQVPRVPEHIILLDKVFGTTINGTAGGAAVISVGGVSTHRTTMPVANSNSFEFSPPGGWPVWRTTGDSGTGWTEAVEMHNPPAPGSGTSTDVRGGTAGAGENNQAAGQSFTTVPAFVLVGMYVYMRKVGNPTDTAFMNVLSTSIDEGGTGVIISTSPNLSMDLFDALPRWIFFPLPAVALSAATQYFFQVRRNGARSTANYVTGVTTNSSSYAGGGSYTRDSLVWSAESGTNDIAFRAVGDLPVALLVPALSTGTFLGVTYHYERPGIVRN